MKEVLKVYDVELTVEGPVYIGSGKEIGKKEYAFFPQQKRIYVMDISKLCQLLMKKDLMSEYGAFMMGSSRDDLGKWLEHHKVPEKEVMQCVKYHLDCQDVVDDTRSKLSVMEFVKDAYGMPYVPGSSLKGMLRTILQAYDIAQHPRKYQEIKSDIAGSIRANRRIQRNICQRESRRMESCCFHTLERPRTRPQDAVNDHMSGMIVSDSKPLSTEELVLCQQIELHTDGAEKKLNMLRETLCPGTVIHFQVTIDTSICNITKEYLEAAIAYFGKNYYECFLSKYPNLDLPGQQTVWLGGGTGFVTKTEVYPLFGKSQGVDMAIGIFKAVGLPDKHKHVRDRSLGVSPHICKTAYYHGKRCQMGQCRLRISEQT